MRIFAIAALVVFWATVSSAHSPLDSTVPADETIIAEVPAELSLGFKGKIRLTRGAMSFDDRDPIQLDLTGHTGFITDYEIPLENFGRGTYVIAWRGLGTDGHTLNGAFQFTVRE